MKQGLEVLTSQCDRHFALQEHKLMRGSTLFPLMASTQSEPDVHDVGCQNITAQIQSLREARSSSGAQHFKLLFKYPTERQLKCQSMSQDTSVHPSIN